MPRNGSGTYSLPEPAFVPNTPISSSAVNSDFSDVGTALTGSIAADGQTPITGQLKGSNGSVSAPSYSFNTDIDSGLYRIGANNIGIAVNGTKILDIATTGLSITGALSSSGTFVAADGTVSLPAYTFTNDLDCGVYRIGANNLGVAVNATKVLDISTTGLNVIGAVQQNGVALAQAGFATGMINGTIAESHTGNAATFALKTLAGTDPSSTDPVTLLFRNATAATGTYSIIQVTAALSLTISSGSTLGFSSGVPGKLWLVVFNDAGTPRLGIINCLSSLSVYPLGQMPIASSTAEGGVGGADSAQVFYTDSAVSSKAYTVLAYASYESGLATAGSWNVSPTRLQLYAPNVPLPGQFVQRTFTSDPAFASTTAIIPNDDTIPQSSEGAQFMSLAITPTSACNLLEVKHTGQYSAALGAYMAVALFRDIAADAVAAGCDYIATGTVPSRVTLDYMALASSTSSITFKIRAGTQSGTTAGFNSTLASGRVYGGVSNSTLQIHEIVT